MKMYNEKALGPYAFTNADDMTAPVVYWITGDSSETYGIATLEVYDKDLTEGHCDGQCRDINDKDIDTGTKRLSPVGVKSMQQRLFSGSDEAKARITFIHVDDFRSA